METENLPPTKKISIFATYWPSENREFGRSLASFTSAKALFTCENTLTAEALLADETSLR